MSTVPELPLPELCDGLRRRNFVSTHGSGSPGSPWEPQFCTGAHYDDGGVNHPRWFTEVEQAQQHVSTSSTASGGSIADSPTTTASTLPSRPRLGVFGIENPQRSDTPEDRARRSWVLYKREKVDSLRKILPFQWASACTGELIPNYAAFWSVELVLEQDPLRLGVSAMWVSIWAYVFCCCSWTAVLLSIFWALGFCVASQGLYERLLSPLQVVKRVPNLEGWDNSLSLLDLVLSRMKMGEIPYHLKKLATLVFFDLEPDEARAVLAGCHPRIVNFLSLTPQKLYERHWVGRMEVRGGFEARHSAWLEFEERVDKAFSKAKRKDTSETSEDEEQVSLDVDNIPSLQLEDGGLGLNEETQSLGAVPLIKRREEDVWKPPLASNDAEEPPLPTPEQDRHGRPVLSSILRSVLWRRFRSRNRSLAEAFVESYVIPLRHQLEQLCQSPYEGNMQASLNSGLPTDLRSCGHLLRSVFLLLLKEFTSERTYAAVTGAASTAKRATAVMGIALLFFLRRRILRLLVTGKKLLVG